MEDKTARDSKRFSGAETDSVYDFLYCDTRRIGSFLAQFNVAGHLQQITERDNKSDSKRGFKVGIGGGASVAGTGGSGEVSFERSAAETSFNENERVYDPLWTNALKLLEYLDERDLIQRDISRTRIGQFLLARGKLAITDLAIVKRSMELPAVKKLINPNAPLANTGNRQQRRAQSGTAGNPSSAQNLQELAFEMLTIMPHTAQGRLYVDGGHLIWAGLGAESLAITTEDLFLKHGVVIGGEWFVLGVVDALPGTYGEGDESISIFEEIDPNNGGVELLARILPSFVPFTKMTLGRPDRAHGMTPLLIFRKVSG